MVDTHIQWAGRASERTFTCPGLSMPQPADYVACYRAGHSCTSVNETTEDERGRESRNFCPCCGSWHGSLFIPRAMMDEPPEVSA